MTRWTHKRLDAVIGAVTAMLAQEEGEGDGVGIAFEDLQDGLKRLREERARLKKRTNSR